MGKKKAAVTIADVLKPLLERATEGFGYRWRIYANGSVESIGVNYETRRCSIEAWTDDTLVIRVPGRSVWDGNYSPRRYVGPELLVFRIVAVTAPLQASFCVVDVEPLIEIPVGRKRKEGTV